MARDECRTARGSRVSIRTDRHGEFIVCQGCPRPIKITGAGPALFAAREHAERCTR